MPAAKPPAARLISTRENGPAGSMVKPATSAMRVLAVDVQLDGLDRWHGRLDVIELADRWNVDRDGRPNAIDMIQREVRHVTLLNALRPVASTARREEPGEGEIRGADKPGSGDSDHSEADQGRKEFDRRVHAPIVARLSTEAIEIRRRRRDR